MSSKINNPSQNKGRRRDRSNIAIWPFIVGALLIIVIISAYFALRAKSSSSSTTQYGKFTSAPPALHYDNLEIAKSTDAEKERRGIIRNYEGFSLMFNPENATPDWVGWELLASETDGELSRSNRFWTDNSLEGCPSPDDYKNSGYDKGHLCPAADQKWCSEAMRDCFVMANMTPQDHALNAGAWQTLEKKERLWAQRDSAIVIVAGPIYTSADKKQIGSSRVRVPSAFFKVLLAPYIKEPRAIGFIYPNMSAPGNMENYSMSVDDVERITGLDFFSTLPDDIENQIESISSFTLWNL